MFEYVWNLFDTRFKGGWDEKLAKLGYVHSVTCVEDNWRRVELDDFIDRMKEEADLGRWTFFWDFIGDQDVIVFRTFREEDAVYLSLAYGNS